MTDDAHCYHGRDTTQGLPCSGLTDDPHCKGGTDTTNGADCTAAGEPGSPESMQRASGTAPEATSAPPPLTNSCLQGEAASDGISCGFAGNVLMSLQDAYLNGAHPIPATITAWSPTTHENYALNCELINNSKQVLCSIAGQANSQVEFNEYMLQAN
jgi:hypothetical protein